MKPPVYFVLFIILNQTFYKLDYLNGWGDMYWTPDIELLLQMV